MSLFSASRAAPAPARRAPVVALAMAAGLLCASAASAQYVGTYVSQYSGLSGNRNFSAYNFTTDSQFNVFGPSYVGHTEYSGCSPNCTASFARDGTQDTTGHATAAFSSASMSDIDQGGFSSGSGYARADLATGELGASGEGTFRTAFGVDSGIGNRSFATFGDTLDFTIAGATAQTTTDITISLFLEGDMQKTHPNGSGVARTLLDFGFARFDGSIGFSPQTGVFGVLHDTADGFTSSTFTQVGEGYLFTGVYTLHGASVSGLHMGEFLDLSCGNGAICDYNDTAAFSLSLPSNVSYTSASGVFLSNVPGPGGGGGGVPEPSAWALMIAGFGGVGAALRRRRARPALAA